MNYRNIRIKEIRSLTNELLLSQVVLFLLHKLEYPWRYHIFVFSSNLKRNWLVDTKDGFGRPPAWISKFEFIYTLIQPTQVQTTQNGQKQQMLALRCHWDLDLPEVGVWVTKLKISHVFLRFWLALLLKKLVLFDPILLSLKDSRYGFRDFFGLDFCLSFFRFVVTLIALLCCVVIGSHAGGVIISIYA